MDSELYMTRSSLYLHVQCIRARVDLTGSHHHNVTAERIIRTVDDMCKTLSFQACLSGAYHAEALSHVCMTWNATMGKKNDHMSTYY